MINKKQVQLQDIADHDKNSQRYTIKKVYFKDGVAIATDSYKLAKVTNKNFLINKLPEGAIIPEKEIAIYLSDIKVPKSKALPILENVFIEKVEGSCVTLFTLDGDEVTKQTRENEEDFPDTKPVFKQLRDSGTAIREICLSGKYLSEIANFLKEYKEVTIKVRAANEAVEFIAEDENNKVEAIIMPIYNQK